MPIKWAGLGPELLLALDRKLAEPLSAQLERGPVNRSWPASRARTGSGRCAAPAVRSRRTRRDAVIRGP